jgi:YfiH family protein
VGPIKYFKFSSLDTPGLYHAIFTRHGGSSPYPWSSLNFGASVGDDINRVRQNKAKALELLNIKSETVYDVFQVHSTDVVVTDRPLLPGEPHQRADAIITDRTGLTLLMRFADCVPIFLFDRAHHVIALVHAGWMGTIKKIAEQTVQIMMQNFETKPGDIQAGIGPSIGPDHYSIGNDVLELVRSSFGSIADDFISNDHGKVYFDLWGANQYILREIGVEKIEISGICTNCNLQDWFSHRGEQGKTGRFGAVIGLF